MEIFKQYNIYNQKYIILKRCKVSFTEHFYPIRKEK